MRAGTRTRLGVALMMAVAVAGSSPGIGAAQTAGAIDCAAPDLERIAAELDVARAAVVAGNRAALLAAVTSARDQLGAIAAACGGSGVPTSPVPSLAPSPSPTALDATGRVGEFRFSHPARLVELEAEVLQSGESPRVDTVTLGDSPEADDLLDGPLEAPLSDEREIVSLAVGEPLGILAAIGVFEGDDAVPTEPLSTLELLGERTEAETEGSPARLAAGDVAPLTFSDGSLGGVLPFTFVDAGDVLLAHGAFVLRELPSGAWALGLAIGSPTTMARLGPELEALVGSVERG